MTLCVYKKNPSGEDRLLGEFSLWDVPKELTDKAFSECGITLLSGGTNISLDRQSELWGEIHALQKWVFPENCDEYRRRFCEDTDFTEGLLSGITAAAENGGYPLSDYYFSIR